MKSINWTTVIVVVAFVAAVVVMSLAGKQIPQEFKAGIEVVMLVVVGMLRGIADKPADPPKPPEVTP